jgi:hypothetical protein
MGYPLFCQSPLTDGEQATTTVLLLQYAVADKMTRMTMRQGANVAEPLPPTGPAAPLRRRVAMA